MLRDQRPAWPLLLALPLAIVAAGPSAARAGRIVVVAAADTLDGKIGKSVASDLASVEAVFRAQVRQDVLVFRRVSDQECRPDAILAAVAGAAVGADDALVVYYSGHGAFDARAGHYLKFPRLGPQAYLTRDQIRQTLRNKGCRLGVVLTDSCNKLSAIPRPPMAPSAGAPPPKPRPPVSPLFQVLFLETAGLVDVTSSREGELSLAYPAERLDRESAKRVRGADGAQFYPGGLFTEALLGVFRRFEERPIAWREVVDRTADRVRNEFHRLKPDGLDNEEEPENPQMTQSVTAFSVGSPGRPLPPRGEDGGPGPDEFPVGPFRANLNFGVYGYENPGGGLYVWATRPNSPAARLGLEQGDLVVSVNDARVRTVRGYREALEGSNGMAEVAFRDVRTGQVRTADVALEPGIGSVDGASFGADGVEQPGQGVRVTQVVPGSPAPRAGVDPGDIIQTVNDRAVRTVEEYQRAVRESNDEMRFTVLNVRTGRPLSMVAPLDRRGPQRGLWTLGVHGFDNGGAGVLVWATRPNSPAARLGLERGDLILGVDRTPVRNVRAYHDAIVRSGGRVALVFRDVRTGVVKQADVALEQGPGPGVGPPERSVFGAACAQVAGRGLQVASLVPNSPAALVEVDPGDIILDVNGQSVTTTDEYYQAVRQSDDEMQFTVLNVRTGRPLGMIVQLDR